MTEHPVRTSGTARLREPIAIERQGDGFYSVLAGAAGRVLVTNELGRTVLDLCDGERTAADIASLITTRFSHVPPETIEHDVLTFLKQAMDKEVVTWSS